MKKSLLFLPIAVVLCGCNGAKQVKADEAQKSYKDLNGILLKYIDENGQYTKKTTICLNDATREEMSSYFHCKQTEAGRTTYYDDDDNALLMAPAIGTLDAKASYTDSGYGGYMLFENKIHRICASNTSELNSNLFTTVLKKSQASYSNKTNINEVYKNMSYFASSEYFDESWQYNSEYDQYSYDVKTNYDNREIGDKYYPDFLAFAAPMLKPDYINLGENYLHIQSIGISERYDTNAVPYLSIKIYIKDQDVGKVTGECGVTTMSEARIYKGIRQDTEEDFSVSYFVKGTIGGKSKEIKMQKDPDNENQYYAKGLSLEQNDLITIWSTEREGKWYQTYEHRWSNAISYGGEYAKDYKVLASDTYDIYFKTDSNKSWITAGNKKVYYFKPSEDWKSSSAKFAVWLFDGGSNSDKWSDWLVGNNGIYTINTEGYNKIKIVRFPSTASEKSFNNKWNESGDISINKYIENCINNTNWWDTWNEDQGTSLSLI